MIASPNRNDGATEEHANITELGRNDYRSAVRGICLFMLFCFVFFCWVSHSLIVSLGNWIAAELLSTPLIEPGSNGIHLKAHLA